MTPGTVILISLPQTGSGPPKLRPALVSSELPGPYQDVLICGVSTQLFAQVPDWDELIQQSDTDFNQSGLRYGSLIRLSYLFSVEQSAIVGTIGEISSDRLERLRSRLSQHFSS